MAFCQAWPEHENSTLYLLRMHETTFLEAWEDEFSASENRTPQDSPTHRNWNLSSNFALAAGFMLGSIVETSDVYLSSQLLHVEQVSVKYIPFLKTNVPPENFLNKVFELVFHATYFFFVPFSMILFLWYLMLRPLMIVIYWWLGEALNLAVVELILGHVCQMVISTALTSCEWTFKASLPNINLLLPGIPFLVTLLNIVYNLFADFLANKCSQWKC